MRGERHLAKGSRLSKLKRPVKKRKAPAKASASPEAAVAAAFAQAEAAIAVLKTQADVHGSLSQQALADLDTLIEDAGGTPPSRTPKA
jgi:hypothetical protein